MNLPFTSLHWASKPSGIQFQQRSLVGFLYLPWKTQGENTTSLYVKVSSHFKYPHKYDECGFSRLTIALSSVAAHSAKAKVLDAIMFAWRHSAPQPVRPWGLADDRKRVRQDRSRALEKVEQGGAKWIAN